MAGHVTTIRWVKTKELKDQYVDDTEEKITEDALASSSAKLLPPETVLMAMYGDGKTITSLGILRSESACNQACCAMVVFCLSWKWRKRSSVKIMERTYEERAQALLCGRESCGSEAASFGQSASFGT